MRSRRAGLAHVAALLSCAGLIAGCASSGTSHRAQATPSAAAPSVTAAPTTEPPKATKVSSPDALGARRVIPVPKTLAQQQLHRLLAVDGQTTLLDAGPGSKP